MVDRKLHLHGVLPANDANSYHSKAKALRTRKNEITGKTVQEGKPQKRDDSHVA